MLFGLSNDLLTNPRIVDEADVTISTTAANVGLPTQKLDLGPGDITVLWIVSHSVRATTAQMEYSFGIRVNSVDYFPTGQIRGGGLSPYGWHSAGSVVAETNQPRPYNAYQTVGNNQIYPSTFVPIIYMFDVDDFGIAMGWQTIQPRIKEVKTAAGGTLRGSSDFATRIAWAVLRGPRRDRPC